MEEKRDLFEDLLKIWKAMPDWYREDMMSVVQSDNYPSEKFTIDEDPPGSFLVVAVIRFGKGVEQHVEDSRKFQQQQNSEQ